MMDMCFLNGGEAQRRGGAAAQPGEVAQGAIRRHAGAGAQQVLQAPEFKSAWRQKARGQKSRARRHLHRQ